MFSSRIVRFSLVSLFAAGLAIGCASGAPRTDDLDGEGAVAGDEAEATSTLPAPGDTAGRLYYGTAEWAYLTDEDPLSEWVFSAKGKHEFKTSVTARAADGVGIDMTKKVGFKLYGLSRTWSGKLVWTLLAKTDGPKGQAVIKLTGAVDRTYMLTAAAGQFPTTIEIGLSCAGGTANCALRQQPGDMCGGIAAGKFKCDTGLFCNYPAPTCGKADAAGTCAKPTRICPKFYSPVCGCDGKTYGNGCEATAASVSVKSTGACACDKAKYENFDPSMGHMAETTWSDEAQSWFYAFNLDGTFSAKFAPPCLRTEPSCKIRSELRTGKFFIIGSTVQLNYSDGLTGKYTAQWNCEETKRFVGVDRGEVRTLATSPIGMP